MAPWKRAGGMAGNTGRTSDSRPRLSSYTPISSTTIAASAESPGAANDSVVGPPAASGNTVRPPSAISIGACDDPIVNATVCGDATRTISVRARDGTAGSRSIVNVFAGVEVQTRYRPTFNCIVRASHVPGAPAARHCAAMPAAIAGGVPASTSRTS